jgi:hypothetical protein
MGGLAAPDNPAAPARQQTKIADRQSPGGEVVACHRLRKNPAWVICRTPSDNWDEDLMDFADYARVEVGLYASADSEPYATITYDRFKHLAARINWGDLHLSGNELIQGGALRVPPKSFPTRTPAPAGPDSIKTNDKGTL